MVCQEGMVNLQQIRLVDAYSQSIWGLRIRRSDIENAGKALFAAGIMHLSSEAVVETIQRLVICERRTERIMGGDRVEGAGLLL